MIYHIDADLKGLPFQYRPVAETGDRLKTFKVASYVDYETAMDKIASEVSANDAVVIDTLSQLAETTIDDIKSRQAAGRMLTTMWDSVEVLKAEGSYGSEYKAMVPMVMQKIKNCMARGARVIVNVHQKTDYMDADKTTKLAVSQKTGIPLDAEKVKGPSVNRKLFEVLNARATDIYRLSRFNADVTDKEGEIAIPYGTRLLHLAEDVDDVIKSSAPPEALARLREGLYNPTLPKLCKIIGGKPDLMVVYSPPGVGKTTFSLSTLDLKTKKEEKS